MLDVPSNISCDCCVACGSYVTPGILRHSQFKGELTVPGTLVRRYDVPGTRVKYQVLRSGRAVLVLLIIVSFDPHREKIGGSTAFRVVKVCCSISQQQLLRRGIGSDYTSYLVQVYVACRVRSSAGAYL